MKTVYLLDRLINKPVKVTNVPDDIEINPGDYVVYKSTEDSKFFVWVNTWYDMEASKSGTFDKVLHHNLREKFMENQQIANQYFQVFKKEFKNQFPNTKPVSARINLQGNLIYFYFYCEDRLNFTWFIPEFKKLVPINFFFYQVWARDMIRLHPDADKWLTECGCGPVWCCGNGVLPSIDMENLVLQSLEGRDIEKLKWRCGKLKCSVVYERYLYLEEADKFPSKWDTVQYADLKWRCINRNIMNQEVAIKTEDWHVVRTHYKNVKIIWKGKESTIDTLGITKEEAAKLKEV